MAQVSSLLCCDSAVFTRGCWTFLNVFEDLQFREFPTIHPGWDVVAALGSLNPLAESSVELVVVDMLRELEGDPDSVVHHDLQEVETDSRSTIEWLRFEVGNTAFERPTTLQLRLLTDGFLVETGTIHVREA